MKKYRIVKEINYKGEVLRYIVQSKGFIFWNFERSLSSYEYAIEAIENLKKSYTYIYPPFPEKEPE